jgi:hypothetical protein
VKLSNSDKGFVDAGAAAGLMQFANFSATAPLEQEEI